MPTVYLKMGLPNFLNIYVWYKVMGFIKTFQLKGVLSYILTYLPPTYSCLSFYEFPSCVKYSSTLCVSYTCI